MMKTFILGLIILIFVGCSASHKSTAKLPTLLKGNFVDDYNIKYTISDSLFFQQPNAKYHILEWNQSEGYLLAKNDKKNPSGGKKYSRIDYMIFSDMAPYNWGFCLTVYDARDAATAKKVPAANRSEPKKGCNGFPFSRMKRSE